MVIICVLPAERAPWVYSLLSARSITRPTSSGRRAERVTGPRAPYFRLAFHARCASACAESRSVADVIQS